MYLGFTRNKRLKFSHECRVVLACKISDGSRHEATRGRNKKSHPKSGCPRVPKYPSLYNDILVFEKTRI